MTDGGAPATDALDTWTRIINALGLPLALLSIVGIVAWRIAKWVAPRVDALFQEQIRFIHVTSKMVEELRVDVSALRTFADQNTAAVRELTEEVREMRKARKAS